MMRPDTFRHQGLRRNLVVQLKAKGIVKEDVLAAIGKVPRHLFIDDSAFEDLAYTDQAFPIACGQTISHPYTVAFQSAALELGRGMKVLEIGTGSGYQAAVLIELGAKLFSIERHRPLYMSTKTRLTALGYRASLFHGDGFKGSPMEAPFDRILVTCGAPFVPQALLDQLKVGGRLVIPVGEGGVQRMEMHVKQGDGTTLAKELGEFRFVPMLQNKVE